jgi:DNA-binding IclR family transcriptional regulator
MTSGFSVSEAILLRITREYEEQPGLRLTPAQAQRLWGLDGPTCRTALTALVDAGILRRSPDGQFARRRSAA